MVFIFTLRRRVPNCCSVILLALPLLAVFWFALPPTSRDYATGFGQEHYNIKLRYEFDRSGAKITFTKARFTAWAWGCVKIMMRPMSF